MSAASISTTLPKITAPTAAHPTSSSGRVFYQVGGKGGDREKFAQFREIFERILTPLYGSQDKAIGQVAESKDRKAFLLCNEDDSGSHPVGILVLKTDPTDEFSDKGVSKSIEIKSLFIDSAARNSGKGLGSTLLSKFDEEVEKLPNPGLGAHVTVGGDVTDSLSFFQKKGFEIQHVWEGRYRAGVKEYLLSRPRVILQAGAAAALSAVSLAGRASSVEQAIHACIQTIAQAHFGDIHTLRLLADGTFLSGSKDGMIKKWNLDGSVAAVVQDVEPTQLTDRDWVTAMDPINDAYFVSGERNGKVYLWKTSGEFVKEIGVKRPRGSHVSHEYNKQRVNCLRAVIDPDRPGFFVGFPTLFDEVNLVEGRTVASTPVDPNDWVYCIEPRTAESVLMVVGCSLDAWRKTEGKWSKTERVISEGKATYHKEGGKSRKQRPFISSLAPLSQGEFSQVSLSLFSGEVKVFDLTEKKVVQTWQEHQHRVWQVAAISPQSLASCGEDKAIKIWDIRSPKSVKTWGGHVGQVTSLLKISEHTLVAGICPETASEPSKVARSAEAELKFYDLRG